MQIHRGEGELVANNWAHFLTQLDQDSRCPGCGGKAVDGTELRRGRSAVLGHERFDAPPRSGISRLADEDAGWEHGV